MKKHSIFVLFLILAGSASSALAREGRNYLIQAPLPGASLDDRPLHLQSLATRPSGACTLSFGNVDSEGFAILGDIWDFDHGGADPFEGWTARDLTAQTRTFWRRISPNIWVDGDVDNGSVPTNNNLPAPILSGEGSAWIGAYENEADDLCWTTGLGYGNGWCQELRGPVLDYDGSSTITIGFEYFTDTELDFDYSHVVIQTMPSGTETELARFTDQVGLAADHPDSPPVGETAAFEFSSFGSDTQFRLIFRMTADAGWSDSDGEYTTEYGPFAVDDITLGNTGATGDVDVVYDFESDLNGWMPEACPGVGSFEGIAQVSTYVLEDPCTCQLAGNVLEQHDNRQEHPDGQRTLMESNPVDVLNDVRGVCGTQGQLEIFADWSQYSEQPRFNGVFYRPGWSYYPFICPTTGEAGWSERVGQTTFFSTGRLPVCFEARSIATDNGIPPNVEQIRMSYELFASCDAFGISPTECDVRYANFTPLIDNIQIRFTLVPEAPPIAFEPGARYTDGFSQHLLAIDTPGNANVVLNTSFGNTNPMINGDSLAVRGPIPTPESEYDTRLWFRVARKGPGTDTAGYDAWRTMVQTDGGIDAGIDFSADIEGGDFATAKMDTAQTGPTLHAGRFVSYFIEEDARFALNGTSELTEGQEIIRDGMLLPGTAIEYFLTTNYTSINPVQFFLLPDTSGGFFEEFEILPGWEFSSGFSRFPCVLYINAYNRGAQGVIENALGAMGMKTDRYDYLDASSNWKTPLARGLTSDANNGCSKWQLLGYRAILVNTGDLSGAVMWPEDYTQFSDWLTTISCDANTFRQGLLMNGDNMAGILNTLAPSLLSGPLGAAYIANSYNEEGPAPDEQYCVRLESPTVGSIRYDTSNSANDYDYDAYGNWCPQRFAFDVLGTLGSGIGNRTYVNTASGEEANYAQIVNEDTRDNYRTVLDGVSWHHLSERDAVEECVGDSAHIVTAAYNEILAAMEWIFGAGSIPFICGEPCFGSGDVPDPEIISDAQVTRLYQNSPNPFNPRTMLRFSLASSGPAELVICDVTGRRVRTLVDETLEAGLHEVVWDGTNDAGKELAAGVYWSQFEALGQKSNKKMVLLSR